MAKLFMIKTIADGKQAEAGDDLANDYVLGRPALRATKPIA